MANGARMLLSGDKVNAMFTELRADFCYAMSMRQNSCFAGGLNGLQKALLATHLSATARSRLPA
jgi:hypothetical protein